MGTKQEQKPDQTLTVALAVGKEDYTFLSNVFRCISDDLKEIKANGFKVYQMNK
jgi:hypothetical protein